MPSISSAVAVLSRARLSLRNVHAMKRSSVLDGMSLNVKRNEVKIPTQAQAGEQAAATGALHCAGGKSQIWKKMKKRRKLQGQQRAV